MIQSRNLCRHGLPPACCALCIEERRRQRRLAEAAALGTTVRALDADTTAPDPEAEAQS